MRFKHHSIYHKTHPISELTDSDLFGKMLWQTGGDFMRQIFQRLMALVVKRVLTSAP